MMTTLPTSQFSKLKFNVSDILDQIDSYAPCNFVFAFYLPAVGDPFTAIAYSAVKESDGNIDYPGAPIILEAIPGEELDTADAVILSNNCIPISSVNSLIVDAQATDYLVLHPQIFNNPATNLNYIYYSINLDHSAPGGGVTINTNPSPPAPAPNSDQYFDK